MVYARLVFTVMAFAFASTVFGQQPTPALPAGRIPTPPADDPKAASIAGKPGVPGTPAEAPKENQRLQKLQQLQFDRRPSAILKGWATFHKPPEKDESKPEPDKPEKKDPID